MDLWGARLRAAVPPLRVFAGSRLVVWMVAVYAWVWFAPLRLPAGDLGYVTQVWSRADSNWFLDIARHGYGHNGSGSTVFYPLYPLSIAGLGRALGGYYVTAGILISLVCGAAAFVLLHRLALPRLGPEGASRAVLYLAVFPMSLFLQAVYSESMFLLCAVSAFLAAERRRWLLAGVAIGLATLTRIAGVALFPAILLLAWRSPERRRAVASLGIAPLLAGLYPLWLQIKLHAVFAEFSNEAGWNRYVSKAGPLGGAWHGLQAAWAGLEQLVTGDRTHAFWTASHSDPLYVAAHNLVDFAFFAGFIALGIVAWRRFGAPYGVYVLGSLAIAASVPHSSYPLLSVPRFCLTLFPAFFALASLATTARRDRIVIVISSVFLAVAVVQWTTGYWVS